jgi:ribonucleoside-triphosphate reductase
LNIGSAVVNTTNLRRLAILADHDEDKFMQMLADYTKLSMKVMHVTRNILKRNVEKGLLPNYKTGLVSFENQFNTIGINGMYECIRDFGYIRTDEFGNKFYTDKGLALAERIFAMLNRMRKQHDYGYSINVESVPAETAAVVLCKKDSLLYGNPHEDYIYANQWLALTEKCTVEEKIKLSAILDKQCGGGAICHISCEAPFANKDQAWDMLNHIAESGVIYFAFNVKIPICKNGHCFFGEVCPKCGGEVADTVQRTVGYLRPTSDFTKEKKREAAEKVWFNLE